MFVFADSSSGLGALGVDGQAFLIQLVTFILAYLVLRKWAFGPIIKRLRERRETIESGVNLGEEMQREKTKLEAKVEQTLHKARSDADQIISSANDAARSAVAEAETSARQKAEAILKDARERIKIDTNRAKRQLEDDLVGLVGEATEAILREKVDAAKDSQLIKRFLRENQI